MAKTNTAPPRPLSRIVFSTFALFLIPPLALMLGFWIALESLHFARATETIRQAYLTEQKVQVKQEVDQVYALIQKRINLTEERLKTTLRERGLMARDILRDLHDKWAGRIGDAELRKILIDAIRPIRFAGGRGYYFVADMKGFTLLNPSNPLLEGTNQYDIQDSDGLYIVHKMLDTIQQTGDGFVKYRWLHPKQPGNYHEKVSYVVSFPPMGWFLGIGDYVEDFDEELRKETLEQIGQFSFGTDGYIFVYDQAGNVLQNAANPVSIGKNLLAYTDPNGFKVTREILKTALQSPEGGWLSYIYSRPSNGEQSPKLSYVRHVDRWGWTIGTGVYLQDIENAVAGITADLGLAVRVKLAAIAGIVVIMMAAMWFIVRRLSGLLKRHVLSFGRYFELAAQEYQIIPLDKIGISEFEQIASAANEMIAALRNQLHEARKQMLEREKMAGLGDIVGSATHEIGTPLGIGITLSSMLVERSENLRQKAIQGELTRSDLDEYLRSVQESGNLILHNLQRGAELMTGLKVIAVDQVKGERRTFKLRDYLDKIVLSMQPRLRATSHRIELDCPPELTIDGNPGIFYQILTNLIANSLIHAFEGVQNGRMEINVRSEIRGGEERIIIIYKDNGRGVAPEVAEHIFEPYFTTRKDRGGTGLGLHIVETLIREELRGTVGFKSRIGEGVEFVIDIPAQPSEIDANAA